MCDSHQPLNGADSEPWDFTNHEHDDWADGDCSRCQYLELRKVAE